MVCIILELQVKLFGGSRRQPRLRPNTEALHNWYWGHCTFRTPDMKEAAGKPVASHTKLVEGCARNDYRRYATVLNLTCWRTLVFCWKKVLHSGQLRSRLFPHRLAARVACCLLQCPSGHLSLHPRTFVQLPT